MTESSLEGEDVFRWTREFLNKTGFPGDDKISLFTTVLRNVENMAAMEQTRTAEEARNIKTLKITCTKLIFGNYILVLNKIAALSNTLQEISKLAYEIPKEMQPKVDEVRGYAMRVQQKMVTINDGISKMAEKIKKASENAFKMSSTETKQLEKDWILVDFELKTCADYVTEMEQVLNNLKSEATTKLVTLLGLGTGLGVVGLTAIIGVRLGIAVAVAFMALKVWAATRKISPAVSGGAGWAHAYHSLATVGVNLGAGYVCYQLRTVLARHSSRISEAENINGKLQETKVLYNRKQGSGEINE